MKTYRNERSGFEIDLPVNWSPVPIPPQGGKRLLQYGCRDEAFNFEIGPLFPEPALDDTETEFRLFAQNRGFSEPKFARIAVAGKEHVCASYKISDRLGSRWNKKYMLVFGRTEFAITATCNDPLWFAKREKDWDAIVQTFRLLAPVDNAANNTARAELERSRRRELVEQRLAMREVAGVLYGRAYEAVEMRRYREARRLLEECIRDDPDHVLAHKELAVVLKQLDDIKGSLRHRREVRRLAPDDIVNRVELIELLAGSGKRSGALRETKELLAASPNNRLLQALEQKLVHFRFADYRMLFFSCFACLLLLDLGLLTGGMSIRDVWFVRLTMLVAVGGMFVSGPWVGIPRIVAGLVASALYLFMLMRI